ncbi:hypothetical protein B9Z55_024482 [Caenorhabditis nigoni]|uniref:Uncharacterized protein n=1 Tax=Caenorhabditis nigoni TaxID=1611254 RepID=A0A2G5SUG1_9PELO|nr:hypothetical protein B9Z55_024482 [Caenorhabditis nigoni]
MTRNKRNMKKNEAKEKAEAATKEKQEKIAAAKQESEESIWYYTFLIQICAVFYHLLCYGSSNNKNPLMSENLVSAVVIVIANLVSLYLSQQNSIAFDSIQDYVVLCQIAWVLNMCSKLPSDQILFCKTTPEKLTLKYISYFMMMIITFAQMRHYYLYNKYMNKDHEKLKKSKK